MIIVCDIDGTLSDHSHRLHYVTEKKPKDWNRYFSQMILDKPIPEAINALPLIYKRQDVEFHLVTGRPERYRKMTEEWLQTHFPFLVGVPLHMRSDNDRRAARVYKEEVVSSLTDPYFAGDRAGIIFIDDDLRNAEMYSNWGLFLWAPKCWEVFK